MKFEVKRHCSHFFGYWCGIRLANYKDDIKHLKKPKKIALRSGTYVFRIKDLISTPVGMVKYQWKTKRSVTKAELAMKICKMLGDAIFKGATFHVDTTTIELVSIKKVEGMKHHYDVYLISREPISIPGLLLAEELVR
jgi:hypothetical protein